MAWSGVSALSARRALGLGRLAVGLACWWAPDRAARFFGIEPAADHRFVTRLFGARDAALATALLAAPARAVVPVAAAGAAIDLVDTIAGVHEAGRGTMTRRAVVLGPGGALAFAALGAAVLRGAVATGRR